MPKKLLFNFNREVIQNYTYVKYVGTIITATNTLEKPIKGAILKGNTLVNLQPMTSIAYQSSHDGIIAKENNRIICTSKSTVSTNIRFNYKADASKTYTVKCKLFNNSSSDIKFLDHTINVNKPIVAVPSGETSSINFKFKPHSASVNMGVFLFINHGSPRVIDEEVIIEDLIIVEGDYTNQDISYFEGMQSIKMPVLTTTGKNLFKGFTKYDYTVDKHVTIKEITNNSLLYSTSAWNTSVVFYIPINGGKSYITSANTTNVIADDFYFVDELKQIIGTKFSLNKSVTSPINAKFIKWHVRNSNTNVDCLISNFQLEESTSLTSYEPYKTNILTVNEDLELRGIGEVQDTLDLMTGEIVSNFATYTFNGSENFVDNKTSDSHVCFGFNVLNIPTLDSSKSIGLSKDIPYQNWSGDYPDKELIYVKWAMVYVSVSKDKLVSHDVNGLKTFLKERYETGNPISFMYPLREKPIKTVDLSILDQNENKVSLISSFNDTTYITASSETIPPIFEGYLATKEVE